MPTENPPGRHYAAFVRLLASTLDSLGLEHEIISLPSPPDAPRSAVCAMVGTRGPVLYLHGHYDVVPALSQEQFTPRVEQDAVFGRGSSDMKSGLVAMMYAARALNMAGALQEGRLGLMFVPDEETGGRYGFCLPPCLSRTDRSVTDHLHRISADRRFGRSYLATIAS